MTPRFPIIRPDRTLKYDWYLGEDVRVELIDGRTILIPKGYRFNGHSVPRIFWSIVPPFGADIFAALVHDFLYTFARTLGVSRRFCDSHYINFLTCKYYEVSRARSVTMYTAVRLFGWPAYFINSK